MLPKGNSNTYSFSYAKSSGFFLCCLVITFLFSGTVVTAQTTPVFTYTDKAVQIGRGALLLKDSSHRLSLQDVIRDSSRFQPYDKSVINLGISKKTYWLTFIIKNLSEERKLLLHIAQPNLDVAEFYSIEENGSNTYQQSGTSFPFDARYYRHQDIVFGLSVPPHQQKRFFLKVSNATQLILPLKVGSPKEIFEQLIDVDIFFSVLFGIVFCMFFYNLFIYHIVKDPIYIYYALCILAVSLAQGSLAGYTFRYVWPGNTWLAQNGFILFGNISSIALIIFTRRFLHTKFYLPKMNAVLQVSMLPFIVSLLLLFAGMRHESFATMQISTLIYAMYPVFLAWFTYRKGFRPAKYFLFSWLSLCAGGAVFVCKDFGFLPINMFTTDAVQIGFSLQVILLAFALADKINAYKMEKEKSQADRIDLLRKHETLISEHNIILETKIKFRTKELEKSNASLKATMLQLKDAQAQLIASEKMASLGFLTAGIAHEINNPINFVINNLKPLLLDIQDLFGLVTQYQTLASADDCKNFPQVQKIKNYEEEINLNSLQAEVVELIDGIEEGAERTAEIVKGLRNFSHLDAGDLKAVDIHDGINSTLVLLKSSIPSYLQVRKHFTVTRPIECYPGMLNQVFMNMLTNSIYAIKAKKTEGEESIIISTKEEDDWLEISITDTGTGMSDEVQQKMFEPFFTTKPVGEGTGMGMPIVFKIIEKHKGKFSCHSYPGAGTTFILHIPYCTTCQPVPDINAAVETSLT